MGLQTLALHRRKLVIKILEKIIRNIPAGTLPRRAIQFNSAVPERVFYPALQPILTAHCFSFFP